jgi:serine/threonine protein kinase
MSDAYLLQPMITSDSWYECIFCRLADFGLSRLVSEHKTHVSAATMGTVSYMPPEMLNEQRLTKAVSRPRRSSLHTCHRCISASMCIRRAKGSAGKTSMCMAWL